MVLYKRLNLTTLIHFSIETCVVDTKNVITFSCKLRLIQMRHAITKLIYRKEKHRIAEQYILQQTSVTVKYKMFIEIDQEN